MNTPLGDNIGNSLEVLEAIDVLNGKTGILRDLCIKEASKMVSMAKNIDEEESRMEVLEALNSKKAYKKFLEFVKYQKGDIESLKVSPYKIDIKSSKNGVLKRISALSLGKLSVSLGAGRINKEDIIDHTVGIVLHKHINDEIKVNDILCTLYVKKDQDINLDPNDYFEIA